MMIHVWEAHTLSLIHSNWHHYVGPFPTEFTAVFRFDRHTPNGPTDPVSHQMPISGQNQLLTIKVTWEPGKDWLVLVGKNTGKSHISWQDLWFRVDVPFSQPIETPERVTIQCIQVIELNRNTIANAANVGPKR